MPDDHDELIKPIPSLDTHTQAINLVREQVAKLRQYLEDRPADQDPLTSQVYRTWKHRFCIQLGICYGHLQALNAFGFIPIEQFMRLKVEIMGFTLRLAEPVDMGTRDDR